MRKKIIISILMIVLITISSIASSQIIKKDKKEIEEDQKLEINSSGEIELKVSKAFKENVILNNKFHYFGLVQFQFSYYDAGVLHFRMILKAIVLRIFHLPVKIIIDVSEAGAHDWITLDEFTHNAEYIDGAKIQLQGDAKLKYKIGTTREPHAEIKYDLLNEESYGKKQYW